MKKLFKIILMLVTIISSSIIAPISYATTQKQNYSTVYLTKEDKQLFDFYNREIKVYQGFEADNLKMKALNILNSLPNTYFSLEEYDFENLKTYSYDGKDYITVSKYNNILSTLTLTFDGDQFLGTTESDLVNNNGYFQRDTYTNGSLVDSSITDVKYISNDDVIDGIKVLQNLTEDDVTVARFRGLDAGCFAAITGAGGAVIAAIVKLCGAPCALTPPICLGCLAGIVTVGVGSIAAGIAFCWK